MVGFATAGPGRDDVGGPAVAELYAIYVGSQHAGTGIGRLLHHGAVKRMRSQGFSLARLWVIRGNSRARRFYERQGWLVEDVAKTEVRQEGFVVDEVRYVLDLTGGWES